MNSPIVQVRRIYDEPADDDGARVLVDRVWPRGLSKGKARIDEWCKQVAPSTQLRTWYGHDPGRFEEFARRYHAELKDPERAQALAHLRQLAANKTLTLLTATKAIDLGRRQSLRPRSEGHRCRRARPPPRKLASTNGSRRQWPRVAGDRARARPVPGSRRSSSCWRLQR
jgi:uncharacterized protein YeaO (DUF488 family)